MASPLAGQSLAVGDLSPAIGDSPIAKNAHPPALAFQRARGPGTLHAYAALMLACVMLLIAQAPSPADVPGMTLAEAIAYARAHQPTLAAARARIEVTLREVDVAQADWKPSVGALAELVGSSINNSTATQLTGGPAGIIDVVRVGGTAIRPANDLNWRPYASTMLGVGLRQEVFDFGRIAAQTAAARAMGQVERERERFSRLAVEYAVAEAFYAVLAAKGAFEASQEAYKRVEFHRDFAKRAVAAGMRSPIELTRAEADLARYRVGVIRAEAGVGVARSVLAAAVGSNAPQLDALPGDAIPDTHALPKASDVADRVLSESPAVRMGAASAEAQHARTKALDASWRPNLMLSAAATSRAGGGPPTVGDIPAGNGFIPSVANYSVGLVLSWPLWDPGARARVTSSQAREAEVNAELDVTRINAVHAAQQDLLRVETARLALDALDAALDAAKANNAQAEARFHAGLGTSTELADAEAVRVDAEIALVAGRFQLMTARAALARALAEEQ